MANLRWRPWGAQRFRKRDSRCWTALVAAPLGVALGLAALSSPVVASEAELVQGPALSLASPVGWTKDGRSYAWTLLLDHEADSAFRGDFKTRESDPYSEIVVDVRTGRTRLLSDDELRQFFDEHPQHVATQSWVARPDNLMAVVQATGGADRHPRWGDVGDALMLLHPSAEPMRCGMKSEAGRVWPAHTFQPTAGMLEAGVWMDVSPDSRRVVWAFHGRERRQGKPATEARGFADLVVTPVKGPAIQVAGDRPSTADVLATIERLEKARFAPTGADYLTEAGEETMVLARAGHEAEARRVAAALGGGARVAALPGRGRFDVVVVLGRGAGGSKPKGKVRAVALRLAGPNPELAKRGATAAVLRAEVAGALKRCGYTLDEKATAALTITVKGTPYADTATSRFVGDIRLALALDGAERKEILDEDVRLMAALSRDAAAELRATAAELMRAFCDEHGASH